MKKTVEELKKELDAADAATAAYADAYVAACDTADAARAAAYVAACDTADAARAAAYVAYNTAHADAKKKESRLCDEITSIITRRRQTCYGSLQITAEQTEELARAITTYILLEMS